MKSKEEVTAVEGETKPALVPKLRFPEFWLTHGWLIKSFDELFIIGNGRDYKHLKAGEVPVYGSGGYMLSVNDYLYDGESVCIGRKGTINSPLFLTGKFWTVDTLFYTHSFKECLPKFIFSIFQQIDWLKHNEAGGVPSLSKTNIQKIRAAVPKPAEQQKIADCLSSLDELIAAQARKVDVLKTHKKGLMQKIFPREGETQPRFRFPEFTTAGHWKEKPFGDLLNGIIDFRGRTPAKLGMEWGGGKISSLSANNVKNGFIDYAAECNWGSEELYQRWMGGVSLQKDDIVFTMEAPLGKALLLPDSEKYILSQRVVAFKTKPAVKNPFLIQLIWSDGFQRAIDELATGSTAKGINQKALKTVLVKLPEPAEQQHIANCLSSLDTLITAATQKLETLKTHKKGLMQQLFPSPDEATA